MEAAAELEEAAGLARLATKVLAEPSRGPAGLARLAGLDRETLVERVLRHRHTTVEGWLRALRVAALARDLASGCGDFGTAASAAGFGSRASAHRAFVGQLAMPPEAYVELGRDDRFELLLPPRMPVSALLAALGRDAHSRVERVEGNTYVRALRGNRRPFSLRAEFSKGFVRCAVEAPGGARAHEVRAAHRAALRLFGMSLDPRPFERLVASSPTLAPLLQGRRGLTIPLTENLYEGVVWSIVGQQVNLAFAMTCRTRLVERIGNRCPGGLLAHPAPEQVAELEYEDLTRLAFSRRKAEYVIDVSRTIAEGGLDVEALADGSAAVAERTLRAQRGLGPWSTHYVLMRSCGFADCVPVGDSALGASLVEFFGLDERPGPERTLDLLAPFAPHRSLACLHLWRRLGDPKCTAGPT